MSRSLNVLIVEDETPAAEKLERYLHKHHPDNRVLGVCPSVAGAVAWLEQHQASVDLIFMDIQLTDGLSFAIFREVKIEKPVIFITAYNEYALEAFKVNGIDYLLKPVTFADLTASLQKVDTLRQQLAITDARLQKVQALGTRQAHKERFMVKVGDHIRSVTTDHILLFFADGRDVYLVTQQLRKFIIDFTLESLEDVLDPRQFFRINRTYILHIPFVHEVVLYSNSRLKIQTQPPWDKEMIVSREKVNEFKAWFDGAAPG